jgi:hypothetical protein
MSADETEFLDKLRALSVAAAHELLTGVDRLKSLSEELRGNQPDPGKNTKQRASGLAYELARTELEHAEKLLNISHTQADLLFAHARALVQSVRGSSAPAASVVELVVAKGAEAKRAFPIRNPFEERADPRFELEGFKSQNGGDVTALNQALKVECVPARLLARSTGKIQLSVTLPKELEVPSAIYFCKLIVHLSAAIERPVATRLIKLEVS